MKTEYTQEVEVQLHSFWNKALDIEQLTSSLGRFTSGNRRWYQLNRETVSPAWPDWTYSNREKSGIRSLDPPTPTLVDTPNTVSQLR